ncbi:MAG: hypothetical protein P1V81_12920 [Planctomycetota bacterium]|nr:hypothetical protein [Planctomycetota bacterium]
MKDDFYIGYLPTTTPGLGAFLKRTGLAYLAACLVVALGLVASMGGFSSAVFEYGVERDFEGTLVGGPVPMLLVDRPSSEGEPSSYVLTAFGKFGAGPEVEPHAGARVRLSGTLIYRDDRTMVELSAGSIEVLAPVALSRTVSTERTEELGELTLEGEIVDSKCYLGVMKPGNLKPHRACAVRCISGGVPPVLLVRDDAGHASYFFLVSEDGGAVNSEVLDHVAEPVRLTGRAVRRSGQTFLYANPAELQRL